MNVQTLSHTSGSIRRRRCGRSLVEMVAIMAAMSTMLTIAVGMIVLTAKAERASARGIYANTTLLRLARTFRDDVQQAAHVEADDDQLRLTHPGETMITYQNSERGLVRLRQSPDRDMPHRDLFRHVRLLHHEIDDGGEAIPAPVVRVQIGFPREAIADPIGPSPHNHRALTLVAVPRNQAVRNPAEEQTANNSTANNNTANNKTENNNDTAEADPAAENSEENP